MQIPNLIIIYCHTPTMNVTNSLLNPTASNPIRRINQTAIAKPTRLFQNLTLITKFQIPKKKKKREMK